MAIHFVLIYYLISHYSILAKSFGKEPTNGSIFYPDESNSTLLSITYEQPGRAGYSTTHKPIRVKHATLRPNALSNQIHGGNPYQSELVPPTRSYRPPLRPMSPFAPSLNYRSPANGPVRNLTNRLLNYPRILLGGTSKDKFTSPPTLTTPSFTSLPLPSNVSFFGNIPTNEPVIAVNLSSQLRLANTHQQQRVVLNNIQDIINSLKIHEPQEELNHTFQESIGNSNSVTKKNDTNEQQEEKVKSIVLIPNVAPQLNHSSSNKSASGGHSVFKLRFFEKLRQSQNLLREQFRNGNKSNHSLGVNTSKRASENSSVSHNKFLQSLQSRLSNSPKSGEMSPLVGTSPPSVLNRTNSLAVASQSQRESSLAPKFMEVMAGKDSLPVSANRTGEGNRNEGKFMLHLKDLLYRMESKHDYAPNIPTYLAGPKPELTAHSMTIRSPTLSTNLDTSRVDYGEVERILAYVNPYGRRISMPPTNDFSLAESQAHENRNMRFQRSSPPFDWLNESAAESALLDPPTRHQEPILNALTSNVHPRLNSIMSLSGQPHYSSMVEPFDLINFPTKIYRPKELIDFRQVPSLVKPPNAPNRKPLSAGNFPRFGLRNNVLPQFNDNFDFDFNWLDTNQTLHKGKHHQEDLSSMNSTKEVNVDKASPVRSLMEIAKTPIVYNPKDSDFIHFPRQTLVGSEEWRRLNASLFSDGERDWVAYFNDLEHKMKLGRDSPRKPQHEGQKTMPGQKEQSPGRQHLSTDLAQPKPLSLNKTSKSNQKGNNSSITEEATVRMQYGGDKQQWPQFRPTNLEQPYQTVSGSKNGRHTPKVARQGVKNNAANSSKSHRGGDRSKVMATQSSQSEAVVHFPPQSPFHLTRVIKYVNRAHPSWTNVPPPPFYY